MAKDAGTALVEHYDAFYGLALKLLKCRDDALDVVQDAVLACLESGHIKDPVHYCLRAVRNRCFSLLRKRNTLTPVEVSEVWNIASRESVRRATLEDKLEVLRMLKAKLNPYDRAIVELYFEDKHSMEQVALMAGRSKSTINRVVARTKSTLKAGLLAQGIQ